METKLSPSNWLGLDSGHRIINIILIFNCIINIKYYNNNGSFGK